MNEIKLEGLTHLRDNHQELEKIGDAYNRSKTLYGQSSLTKFSEINDPILEKGIDSLAYFLIHCISKAKLKGPWKNLVIEPYISGHVIHVTFQVFGTPHYYELSLEAPDTFHGKIFFQLKTQISYLDFSLKELGNGFWKGFIELVNIGNFYFEPFFPEGKYKPNRRAPIYDIVKHDIYFSTKNTEEMQEFGYFQNRWDAYLRADTFVESVCKALEIYHRMYEKIWSKHTQLHQKTKKI